MDAFLILVCELVAVLYGTIPEFGDGSETLIVFTGPEFRHSPPFSLGYFKKIHAAPCEGYSWPGKSSIQRPRLSDTSLSPSWMFQADMRSTSIGARLESSKLFKGFTSTDWPDVYAAIVASISEEIQFTRDVHHRVPIRGFYDDVTWGDNHAQHEREEARFAVWWDTTYEVLRIRLGEYNTRTGWDDPLSKGISTRMLLCAKGHLDPNGQGKDASILVVDPLMWQFHWVPTARPQFFPSFALAVENR